MEALVVDGEGLGRSRGGLSSKIHLATRYAKHAAYYRVEILIAATVLWMRSKG